MKCFFILLTVVSFCHIISTQSDGDFQSDPGRLTSVLDERLRKCGNVWVAGCLEKRTTQPTGLCQCAPYLEVSSKDQTVRPGGSITLFCLFFGYPFPTVSWKGPQNSLPVGRHTLSDFDNVLVLNGITASDEGNYSCSASNTYGNSTQTLQITVVAAPEFKSATDGPLNISVTEGESVTFRCNPFAIPKAQIVWLQNEQPIDADNPPRRFEFSNDKKNLTIRDVCRDCVDRESKTDLTVIQCNASNVHGYAFGSGYLNVLMKTKVTIRGPENVSVDFLEEQTLIFQCDATSDPSTPPTVRWYKTEPFGDLVRNEPPYVLVENDSLIIKVYPNCSADCVKNLGEYRCVGDNGYSRQNRTITLPYIFRPQPVLERPKEETWASWRIILGAGPIGLILLLVGICLRSHFKHSSGDVNKRMKNRSLPSINDDVGYDSIGIPLEESPGNKEGSTYEHIGYDSIDQVLEEIALKEEAMHRSPDVNEYKGFESIDEPQKEAIRRGRPMLHEDITCDDMGYSMPLENVTNGGEIHRHQVYGCHSVKNESKKYLKSNEVLNTYSDLNREEVTLSLDPKKPDLNAKEVNSYLDLVSKEMNSYLDLVSKEANIYLNPVSTEVNPYLDLVPTEVNPYLDPVSIKVNPYLDLISTEVNHKLDMVSKEVNPYLDLVSKEVHPYLELVSTEVNSYLELVSKEVSPNLDLASKEVDPNLDPRPTERNQYLDLESESRERNQYMALGPKEINQYIDLCPKEVNSYLDLVSKKENQFLDLEFKQTELNQYMGLGPKEMNQYMYLWPKEVNPYLDLVSKKENQYLELKSDPTELNQIHGSGSERNESVHGSLSERNESTLGSGFEGSESILGSGYKGRESLLGSGPGIAISEPIHGTWSERNQLNT